MNHNQLSPEEIELGQKEEFLSQKENILAELELSLSTTKARLGAFEIEYFIKVGSKYVELDKLQALLDKIMASRIPGDPTADKRAKESAERAKQSTQDAEKFKGQDENKSYRFHPSAELRAMYRELAKLLHPDLTLDSKEKERRHSIMQQVNEAYQNGDLQTLKSILEYERHNPESITGNDVAASLVKTIRKLAQADKRIMALQKELEAMCSTDLFILYQLVIEETKKGNDLLANISNELVSRIQFLRDQIETITNLKSENGG